MNLYALFLLIVAVLPWAQARRTTGNKTVTNEQAIAVAVNRFSKKIYQALNTGTDNLVVSPFSISAVLSMLNLGLQGDTETRVTQALFLPAKRSKWTRGFKSTFSTLQATQDVTLEIANKIYAQIGFQVKERFKNDTVKYFGSETEEVDMAGHADEVIESVNNWAAEKTHDKIKNLLAPGSLSPESVMILLNAIYFKGKWKIQFKKEDTSDLPFHMTPDSRKNVQTMKMRTDLSYIELHDLNVQVLKLPYEGEQFSMLILLPREKTGLSNLESNLEQLDIPKLLRRMTTQKVDVKLPRFKILSTIDLNGPLSEVGFSELFTGGANFSGISDDDLYISRALQKAFIEVNEEGTEAAAVTALVVSLGAVGHEPRPVYFTADHPFIYMIVNEQIGTILFMGRVIDPQE